MLMISEDSLARLDDHSGLQDHIKLGTAWLCATLAGVLALVYSAMSQFSRTFTVVILIVSSS